MKCKVEDAEYDWKCAKRKFVEDSVEYHKVIKRDTFVDLEFKRIMKLEVEHVWNIGKVKNSTKICHLVQRYNPKPSQNGDKLRNVKYSDRDLEECAVEIVDEAIIYDNVQISDDGKDVLKMHPKFMLFDPIDEKTIETEIEKGVMKARYAWMNKDDDNRNVGNNGDVEIVRDVSEAVVFSLNGKKANYANIRATELPTVQRLYPPKPAT